MEDESSGERREENVNNVNANNSNDSKSEVTHTSVSTSPVVEDKIKEESMSARSDTQMSPVIEEKAKPVNMMAAAPSHIPTTKVKDEQKLTKDMRDNPWMLSTSVLGVIVILLLFLGNFSGGVTGAVVSEEVVGNNLVEYLNTIAEEGVTLVDVEDEGSMYLVTIEYKGENLPFHVTKDGEYYTPNLLPIFVDAVPDSTSYNIADSVNITIDDDVVNEDNNTSE